MNRSNWLARIFDWLGDALERFNPSAFRFLAASLPYLTPVPVAWLTAHSSAQFLRLPPQIAFVFVFALEGIGLWFTSMLVDAVVDWVRSHNWKSFAPVVLFAAVVYAYVRLLIDLNVTLEMANGIGNAAMSRVITLMCYLPLITGVGNGYYKLKLEHRTQLEMDQQRQREREERERVTQLERDAQERKEKLEREDRIRREQLAEADRIRQQQAAERMEKYRLRMERKPELPTERKPRTNGHRTNGANSERAEQIRSFVRQMQANEQRTPGPTEIANELGVSKSYASETLKIVLNERKPNENKNPV